VNRNPYKKTEKKKFTIDIKKMGVNIDKNEYYTIKDSFCGSMRNIENYWFNTRKIFPDPSILGVFVENHDNPRFLNMCGDRKKFKNASIFSIFYEGIPVYYYGGEQYFAGGADPNNREVLWNNMDRSSDLYKALGAANKVRKEKKTYEKELIQRYADDVFYAFTRGDVLVCVTRGESCSRSITYHQFSEGTQLCDALNPSDCVYVSGGAINVNMGQDPKVYVKK
jgi:alpha-amylase